MLCARKVPVAELAWGRCTAGGAGFGEGDWPLGAILRGGAILMQLVFKSVGSGSVPTLGSLLRLLLVAGMLSACVSAGSGRNEDIDFISSPVGASPPQGVLAIKEGMTQQEVLEILTPLYPVIHAAAAFENNPFVDSFPYSDGDNERFIEVIYREGGRVVRVRFGFEDKYGIM